MVSRPALPAAPPARPGWCRGALMEGGRPPPGEAEGGGGGGGAAAATPTVPSETQLAHVWPWSLRGPQELHSASGELLCQQLEEEMREMQNYVDHVRALTEARGALAAEYERENEELRTRFTQLQLEHESQHKEVAELLALEGLATIVHSSPSEQVAYLLVERSTLLERMEALEQELGAPHCLGKPYAGSSRTSAGPAASPPSEATTTPAAPPRDEEPDGGQPPWEEAGRGLEGAPDQPRSAQEEGIPALGEQLEAAEAERGKLRHSAGAEIWPGRLGQEDEGPQAKPSLPGEPLSAPGPDSHAASELRKASEQNLLTDRLLLHDRLCLPEAEGLASLGGSAGSDLGGCLKHELQGCRCEVLRLHGELRVLQGAVEEGHFLHLTHRKLLHENGRLEAKVLELSCECEHLNQSILRERRVEEEGVLASRLSCPECPSGGQAGEDGAPNQAGDGGEPRWSSEPPSLSWSEASKMGELEKPGQAKQEEEEEEEEDLSFLKDIVAMQCQLRAHREREGAADQPRPPRAALGSPAGDTEQGPPHEEETPGTLRGARQAPGSSGSAKKQQLRLEQELTLELRLQNLRLQQENLQMQAELRQAQVKVLEVCGALALQGELSRQKVKELQLQVLQHSQDAQQHSRLREQLAQESERAAQAEKRVQELEQGLQESRQLWESQAALGRRQLEEEAREARAKEAEARRSLQEEQKRRELLEQEQRRLWLEKEAQLLQALADRQAQLQEGQLRALEDERRALAQEQLQCQSRSQRLSEELWALQRQKEALCEEQRQRQEQVDVSLRKHKERYLRHKARLRQAKEALLDEVKLREDRIRHLEDEARLSKSKAQKDQQLIQQLMEANDSLLRERRKSLEHLYSLEEAKQNSRLAHHVLRSRVKLLDGENLWLQEKSVQLSLQVGILERALRTIHIQSLQGLKSLGFPEGLLQRKLLPFPSFSFSVTSGLCQALREAPPGEPLPEALPSPLALQGSCSGCLNVCGPRKPPDDVCQDQPSHPVG